MNVFLTAEWRNLVNLTYRVEPERLMPYLPQGLELDIIDGSAFLSLVAFDFLNTRVKGVKVPFHVNFPEINLRFYVSYNGRRGVVFIREYVPKHCIAFIANRFYNEPYLSFPMESSCRVLENEEMEVEHKIWKKKDEFSLKLRAGKDESTSKEDSMAHYFKEHDLGFGRDKKGETLCYIVEHPVWTVRDVLDYDLGVDFGRLYGPEWEFLNDAKPAYELFAMGSDVTVYSSMKLNDLPPVPSSSQTSSAEA